MVEGLERRQLDGSTTLKSGRENALYEGHGFSRAVKRDSNEGFSP